jgi:cytoskeletal protein CcmA (bactofilin family)
MFDKDGKDNGAKRKEGALTTVIGIGTLVKGEVVVESNIRLDGKLEGTLKATDTLIVGSTGELIGNAEVKNANVGGKVRGNIVAAQAVVLEANAELHGDVRTKSLVINEGAVLNGNCIMSQPPAANQAATASK